MSTLYTLVAIAAIRYDSVVRLERSWTSPNHSTYFKSLWVISTWLIALILAILPIFGIGKAAVDLGNVRYYILLLIHYKERNK